MGILLVRNGNRQIETATRSGGEGNRPFVNGPGNLDLIDARWVTDGEVEVLAIKANAQLVIEKRLLKRLVRNLGLLAKNQRWNRGGKFRRRLGPSCSMRIAPSPLA